MDFDGSGILIDDVDSLAKASRDSLPVPFYASASRDSARLYLFYGLYWPVDWSGPSDSPRIDHRGDFEGALVVVSRRTRLVEAVVTQAHRLFYLWSPPRRSPSEGIPAAATAGTVPLTRMGRPVLFAESGAHGLYAFGSGSWSPTGGRNYPAGPAGVPRSRLLRIATATEPDESDDKEPQARAELRPLEEIRRFTQGDRGGFRELAAGALPPWLWSDRRGGRLGRAGAMILEPADLYRRLRRTRPP